MSHIYDNNVADHDNPLNTTYVTFSYIFLGNIYKKNVTECKFRLKPNRGRIRFSDLSDNFLEFNVLDNFSKKLI